MLKPLKLNIIVVFMLLLGLSANAQNEEVGEKCGTDAMHELNMQDPEYAAAFFQKKIKIQEYLFDRIDDYRSECDEILFIPVAVHFQGTTGLQMPCAIDKALDQVRILNEDFCGENADITRWEELNPEVWPTIQNKSSCIQFCLATLNHPAGSGIAEGDYAVTINETEGSTNASWSGYMNIYVRNLGGGTLGFSPLGGDGNGDGITVGLPYFSSISCDGVAVNGPYDLGRTATHEAGHYFLLEHPFGSCAADPDGIADTPQTDNATTGCPYVPNDPAANEFITCTAPVLWPSYMDYCDDACLFMFSAGQVDVMDAYAATSLQNLLNSASTTCQDALCIGFRAEIEAAQESCAGGDGAINVALTGGSEPYSFSIDGGFSFQNNGNFGSLQEGTYNVVVRDVNLCEITREVEVTREVPPLEILSQNDAFCGDNSGSVLVQVNHPDEFEYSITSQPGWRDTSLFTGLSPGTYTLTVRNSAECSNSVSVIIGDETDLRFSERQVRPVNCPLLDNGVIWVDVPNGIPPLQFTLNGEGVQNNGRYQNLGQGTYTLEVQDARGCKLQEEYTIGVSFLEIDQECPCDVFVPNAFTPNNDALNDLLDVVPSCPISDYRLQVYDRWGGLVYETDNVNERWNGDQGTGFYARSDIYYYRMTYRWGEARNESLEVQIKTGYVQLMR